MFHGLTPKNVRRLAYEYEMADKNELQMPEKWNETQHAGEDWLNGYLKRHPNLSIRSPEATSLARASAFNVYNISAYFDILEPLIKKLNAGGRVIYNLYESGCTTVQRVPRVISKKGMKQVGQITSRERGELVTLCGIISATVVALPPVFIFPRKNYRDVFLNGSPQGSLGLVNESGWMTGSNFVKVLEHVANFTGSSSDNQIIVTMDNHESHISYESLLFAKNHGINIVTLPPHTSNKTQPLDLSVFGPLKTCFNSTANAWMLSHPGKTITIYQMAQLMGSASLKAATPENILSGFRQAGIWPLDRNVLSNEQLIPSSATDHDYVCSTEERQLPSESTDNSFLNSPSSSYISQITQTSPAAFVSPQQFKGYPKVS